MLLDDLWLEPTQLGKILFAHACQIAIVQGYRMLTLIAEPYALGFYEKMGAAVVGQEESSVLPRRILPMMSLSLEKVNQ